MSHVVYALNVPLRILLSNNIVRRRVVLYVINKVRVKYHMNWRRFEKHFRVSSSSLIRCPDIAYRGLKKPHQPRKLTVHRLDNEQNHNQTQADTFHNLFINALVKKKTHTLGKWRWRHQSLANRLVDWTGHVTCNPVQMVMYCIFLTLLV